MQFVYNINVFRAIGEILIAADIKTQSIDSVAYLNSTVNY